MNKKKREEVYVTGIVCLLLSTILSIFTGNLTINSGWNTYSLTLWVFAGAFGVFGIGSLLKPDSFGVIVLRLMENLAKRQAEESDSHKQIQNKSSGVQIMTQDQSQVSVNVNSAEKQDTKLWKPLPKVNFNVSQVLLRRLQFPTVGWEAYNASPYQLRVRIEVHPILGGKDLYPLPNDLLNGTEVIDGEPESPLFGNGCFSLPQKCAKSKKELILEIRAEVKDIRNPEKGLYQLVPQRWKYIRKSDTWSYHPQRSIT